MSSRRREVLISGAGVAGPVLAYWLRRHGFAVTVVDPAPASRRSGGHAVDLFGTAVDVMDRMGLKDAVLQRRTGSQRIRMSSNRFGDTEVDVSRMASFISDRHIEIMRDDLTALVHEHTADDVEYVHGDAISAIEADADGVDVTFDRGTDRRFDLVIGADGLHSNVRRLVFGPEDRYARFLGGYLGVFSLPDRVGLHDGTIDTYVDVNRVVAFYRAADDPLARAVFVFRSSPLDYHRHDRVRQRELLREAFGDVGWHAPAILSELDGASRFHFDSITQIRMDTWSSGRVSLVGDAGYSPGPVVGGSTSLAVLGAYVLAGWLGTTDGDHTAGFGGYEAAIRPQVESSRAFARKAMRRLLPTGPLAVRAVPKAARLAQAAPEWLARRAARAAQASPLRDTGPLPRF